MERNTNLLMNAMDILPTPLTMGFLEKCFDRLRYRNSEGCYVHRQSAKPHCSSPQTHIHKDTDTLTVPAAMGMENAEVQGHFKYSAARGSPLSVQHILFAHTCTQMRAHTHAHTTHCGGCSIVTIASERAKGPSGENMTLRGSIHIHSHRCESSIETQLSIFVPVTVQI